MDDGDFLTQVKGRLEGFDLLEQVVGQFLAGAHGHGGDIVDRLVGIQLDALAADGGQRIDDMGLDLEQAQFEHLEQADGAGADDHGIAVDGAVEGAVGCDLGRLVGDCHAVFPVMGGASRLSGPAGPACP